MGTPWKIELLFQMYMQYPVKDCYMILQFSNYFSLQRSGSRLDIKMPPYQYSDPIIKIRRSHELLTVLGEFLHLERLSFKTALWIWRHWSEVVEVECIMLPFFRFHKNVWYDNWGSVFLLAGSVPGGGVLPM